MRPRKPTHLKLVEGNKGKRSLDNHEPDPAYLNDLTPPDWLPENVKQIWNEIAPKLRAAKVLTELDIPALEAGCVAISNYRKLTLEIGSEFTVYSSKGGESLSQKLIAQSMYFKQAMAVFQQFGMSPAARTRIAIQPQGDLFGNEKPDPAKAYF